MLLKDLDRPINISDFARISGLSRTTIYKKIASEELVFKPFETYSTMQAVQMYLKNKDKRLMTIRDVTRFSYYYERLKNREEIPKDELHDMIIYTIKFYLSVWRDVPKEVNLAFMRVFDLILSMLSVTASLVLPEERFRDCLFDLLPYIKHYEREDMEPSLEMVLVSLKNDFHIDPRELHTIVKRLLNFYRSEKYWDSESAFQVVDRTARHLRFYIDGQSPMMTEWFLSDFRTLLIDTLKLFLYDVRGERQYGMSDGSDERVSCVYDYDETFEDNFSRVINSVSSELKRSLADDKVCDFGWFALDKYDMKCTMDDGEVVDVKDQLCATFVIRVKERGHNHSVKTIQEFFTMEDLKYPDMIVEVLTKGVTKAEAADNLNIELY